MMEEKRMEYRWPKTMSGEEAKLLFGGDYRPVAGSCLGGRCPVDEKGKGKRRDSGCLCMGKFGAGGWHLYL